MDKAEKSFKVEELVIHEEWIRQALEGAHHVAGAVAAAAAAAARQAVHKHHQQDQRQYQQEFSLVVAQSPKSLKSRPEIP